MFYRAIAAARSAWRVYAPMRSGEGRWVNPAIKEVGPKVTDVKRVPGTDLIAYVGVYK
jgi:hypothetical protein